MKKVILALSFGKPADITPNHLIAGLAREFSKGELRIVADRSIPLLASGREIFIGEDASVHVSTLKLMEEFVNLLQENKWDEVILISEPLYLKRCERDLRWVLAKMGCKCTIIPVKRYKGSDGWFDQYSTQWWIRSRELFSLRETIIMALPWWLYKLIS